MSAEMSPLPRQELSGVRRAVPQRAMATELELQSVERNRQRDHLAIEIQALDHPEQATGVLSPATFAPVAADRLRRPLNGSTHALVAFKPVDPTEALRVLGPLGAAEVRGEISALISPKLNDGDVATRLDNLNILVLVDRTDEESLHKWIESLLHTIGAHIFETYSRSARLGFVAGYATVNRVRHLETLVQQALQVAEGPQGTVHCGDQEAPPPDTQIAGISWDVFLPEALQERRVAVALKPIEELASGSKLYEATPRLLDRAGSEINAEIFLPPARQLGLLNRIERRLLCYAYAAQLSLQRSGKSARVLVPLSAGALDDPELPAFLRSLGSHSDARVAMRSLVIEFDQEDIAGRIRDVERLGREVRDLGCALGIRGFNATRAAEQLLDIVPFATVRLASELIERLGSDEALRSSLRAVADHCAKASIVLIASDVPDANAIAMLYNLGIGTVEGPVIGKPTLFTSATAEEEPLLKELNSV